MEVTIRWQTGKPKEGGYYLITTANGRIDTDHWMIFTNISCWKYYNKFEEGYDFWKTESLRLEQRVQAVFKHFDSLPWYKKMFFKFDV